MSIHFSSRIILAISDNEHASGGNLEMARSVFHSFHYQNDISRVMKVRNRWVAYRNQTVSDIIDHAAFEKVQR